MTLKLALQNAVKLLDSKRIESASLTAEVLLRHVLNLTRVQLFLQLDSEISPVQFGAFEKLLERHIGGEPVAYLTGHKEFFGLDFKVDSRVLIPRPETELLVEKALGLVKERSYSSIADIGTGSGAVAVVLSLNLPGVKIFASDISLSALELAAQNSLNHNVQDKITFLHGDLLEPVPGPIDLIVANLPYVKEADLAEPSIKFEPLLALGGGLDGLYQFRRFVPQVKAKLSPGGSLLMEIGLGQSEAVESLLKASFESARIDIFKDFNGIERIVQTTEISL